MEDRYQASDKKSVNFESMEWWKSFDNIRFFDTVFSVHQVLERSNEKIKFLLVVIERIFYLQKIKIFMVG